ncbi:FAD-dependent oxidoreductase [Qipengyuania flava]|uniref:FAD-dependent oxidoreductase n=1 Tax=Qipengyuania flava TaxID=192812 RepID=UPI0039F63D76
MPGKVVVIGGGVVGFNAAQMAVGLGADVTILDRDPEVLEKVGTHFEARASTRFSNAANLYDAVTNADLVIGAVLIPAQRHQAGDTRNAQDMQKGAVLVDVAIGSGRLLRNEHRGRCRAPIAWLRNAPSPP